MADYNAFKGNAYGLANTLNQTAIFKPSLKNKKLNNMYYTGQLTVPGPEFHHQSFLEKSLQIKYKNRCKK